MAFHVELSRRAKQDLIEIALYIGAPSTLQAKRWLSGLEETAASLADLPERGILLRAHPDYRQFLYGSSPHVYRIIYRIKRASRISIVHIRHGARAGDGL